MGMWGWKGGEGQIDFSCKEEGDQWEQEEYYREKYDLNVFSICMEML